VLPAAVQDFADHATGRAHRADPVAGRTGGPAGNARLTAWVGLALLVLFGVETLTLFDVHSLINWHIIVGVALIPPALVKTGTTVWRFIRYYTGDRAYNAAGPPPFLLRILGPFVVLSTLAVLLTGVLLALNGPGPAQFGLQRLHKLSFLLWAGVTGLHVLGRLMPAARLTVARAAKLPGRPLRAAVLALTMVVAIASGALAASLVGRWQSDNGPPDGGHHAFIDEHP
jgi:hypothetical protein